ncbi:hypothetical protein D3C86_1705490 [compost metagenome]
MYVRDAYKTAGKTQTFLLDENTIFLKTHAESHAFYRIGYLYDYLYDEKIDHSYGSGVFVLKLWSEKMRAHNSTGFWFLSIGGKIRYVADAFIP